MRTIRLRVGAGAVDGDSGNWTIVCFSSVDWASYRQRPQHVMAELADRGCEVLFVDNIGARLPRLRDARRLLARGKRALVKLRRSGQALPPRVRLSTGFVVPLQHLGWVRRLEARRLVKRLSKLLPAGRPLIVWTYVPMPVVRDAATLVGADLLVFDWADDFSERVLTRSSNHSRRLAHWEDEMAEDADLVFLSSETLATRRCPASSNASVIPHGTLATQTGPGTLEELAGVPRPRIGFVGAINEWIDRDLLRDLARARPDWSFVLVGPAEVSLGGVQDLPNVIWCGERPHHEVSRFINEFDVGLIPYRSASGTVAVNPVKLREYLAQGLPVVGSDMPELRPFGEDVFFGDGAAGFAEAIERALARGHRAPLSVPTWGNQVDTMVDHVSRALDGRGHD
jgi:glycosyltransferase involved in cell wall biosynthesis